jgi:hypothetical protein
MQGHNTKSNIINLLELTHWKIIVHQYIESADGLDLILLYLEENKTDHILNI